MAYPRIRTVTLMALGALWAVPALAQAPDTATDRPDRLVMIGLGPRVAPSFPGSTRAAVGVTPVVNVWRENEPLPVETPDEAKGIKLFGLRRTASAGIALAFAPQRGREAATEGLDTIGFGMEAGPYVEAYVLPALRLRAELRQGIGGHGALNADLAADLVVRGAGDRTVFTAGPRARFASAKYNRRFFGISSAESVASGLPAYRPGGGLYSLGGVAGAYYPLGGQAGLFGFAAYDRLVNGAERSPLVRQRGSANQVSAGLALTWVFRIKR